MAGHNAFSSQGNATEKKEHLYKILVIGDLGTGKTSIIKRYVHNFFSQHYRATIGVDFALKVIQWDSDNVVRLQLWDIAGQERFTQMTRVYYKDAVGCFIVFDITRTSTFESVLKWKADLDSKVHLQDGSLIPCVLLANKSDMEAEGMSAISSSGYGSGSKLEEFCKQHNFLSCYKTSAKENVGIDEAAKELVTIVLQNEAARQRGLDSPNGPAGATGASNADTITLDQRYSSRQNPDAARKKCCS